MQTRWSKKQSALWAIFRPVGAILKRLFQHNGLPSVGPWGPDSALLKAASPPRPPPPDPRLTTQAGGGRAFFLRDEDEVGVRWCGGNPDGSHEEP